MEIEIIKWIITALLGITVWFLKLTVTTTRDQLKEIEQEVNRIKLNYLHRDDFREFKIELRSMFDELKRDLKEGLRDNHEKG